MAWSARAMLQRIPSRLVFERIAHPLSLLLEANSIGSRETVLRATRLAHVRVIHYVSLYRLSKSVSVLGGGYLSAGPTVQVLIRVKGAS